MGTDPLVTPNSYKGGDRQLTDDGIDDILIALTDYISQTSDIFDDDRLYDGWAYLVRELLYPYSNGYRNYN